MKQDIIPKNYDEYVNCAFNREIRSSERTAKASEPRTIRSGEASIGDARLTSTIYAPIDGTVLNRKVEVGEPIISTESSQAATEMMSLADMNSLIFKGSVSEHDAARHLRACLYVTYRCALSWYGNFRCVNQSCNQSENLNSPEGNATAKALITGLMEVGELKDPERILLRSSYSSLHKSHWRNLRMS